MKIRANWFTQPEHPESSSPNSAAIPNSCWFCGFAPDGSTADKDDEKPKRCTKCGMLSLNTLPADELLTADPSAQVRDAPSSFVVNVNNSRKVTADFSKGLTPQSIEQLRTDLQFLGLPLDKTQQITRILDDHRSLIQNQQQQMQQTQQQQVQFNQSFPTMRPTSSRIRASDIVKEELKNKIEEVVEHLVSQGADEDDAKEMIKAIVDNEIDVSASLDRLSVWAEPIVKHDYTPPLAESSTEPPAKLRKPKKVRRKK